MDNIRTVHIQDSIVVNVSAGQMPEENRDPDVAYVETGSPHVARGWGYDGESFVPPEGWSDPSLPDPMLEQA